MYLVHSFHSGNSLSINEILSILFRFLSDLYIELALIEDLSWPKGPCIDFFQVRRGGRESPQKTGGETCN